MDKVEKRTKSKTSIVFGNILFCAYVLFMVVTISISSFIWYQKNYFHSYWVNGQSMWPTLNAEALDRYGNKYGENHGDISGATQIDYVIGDGSKQLLNSIKRFDIIVCKYYGGESEKDKIKRVIVLPGETFYIESTVAGDSNNGRLHILNNETKQYEVVDQPLEDYYVTVGKYPLKYAEPTTLASDEYFVMGDNRKGDNSSDSRQNGFITRKNIESVVIALVARCSIYSTKDEKELIVYKEKDVKYFWPRFF